MCKKSRVATEHFTIGGAKSLETSLNIIKLQIQFIATYNEDFRYNFVVASTKLGEEATNFVIPVCPSVRSDLGSYWTDFHEFFFFTNATHVLMDFVVLPPGQSRNVTDFLDWEAHETRLCCSDDVSGDIGGWSTRRAIKPKFY